MGRRVCRTRNRPVKVARRVDVAGLEPGVASGVDYVIEFDVVAVLEAELAIFGHTAALAGRFFPALFLGLVLFGVFFLGLGKLEKGALDGV